MTGQPNQTARDALNQERKRLAVQGQKALRAIDDQQRKLRALEAQMDDIDRALEGLNR